MLAEDSILAEEPFVGLALPLRLREPEEDTVRVTERKPVRKLSCAVGIGREGVSPTRVVNCVRVSRLWFALELALDGVDEEADGELGSAEKFSRVGSSSGSASNSLRDVSQT